MRIQKALFFLFLFLQTGVSSGAFANAADTCWTRENYKEEGRPFSSWHEWNQTRTDWLKRKSLAYNPLYLIKAYKIAQTEAARAESLGGDKMAHCYIGCRISQETNFETAHFAAWYKEMKDLTDCNPSSSFEYTDYAVTYFGAQLRAQTPRQCIQLCADTIIGSTPGVPAP